MSTEQADTKTTAGVPPVPPVGAPCWIEIMAEEPTKLKEFYAALFPAWNWKDTSHAAGVIMYDFKQPSGISGGIIPLPKECVRAEQSMGSGMTVYYFVNSIEDFEKEATAVGAKLVLPKTKESENGWFANFKDIEGNRFGVYEVNWEGMKGQAGGEEKSAE
ncbi:hypothetical protein P154DRAFT_560863 [Amniculicola lignicola CBS 123094]|uniref:VOC domain-containing protein n=1 Tax=Amniculicola lignicola CBS 123094 TaxID=1392246 RepID=A0A6A5WSV0_9PLEO|nr:hypothetical protein P154DRAFT_560863 [Amniculicola lignicola CBS 123094]